jgi:EAL domain-containing protein (putative c-di-GMP-specific phosphodiesterase class I)
MQAIAEGVETEAQHGALQRLGIPYGQGYLYRRPVAVEELFGVRPEECRGPIQQIDTART